LLMEHRRHPNLEVNHGFGHCWLLECLWEHGLTG
jgi:hypothetical protein